MKPEKMENTIYSEYEDALRSFRLSVSCAAGYTGIALILLGAGLDYGLYPEMQIPFAIARVVVSVMIFGIILLMRTSWGRDNVRWLTFLWLFLPQIMISTMIGVTDGAVSLYSSGLHLAIYASGMVLAFGRWQQILFGGATAVLYFIACSRHPETFIPEGALVVNTLFLLFSVALSTLYAIFNERARFSLFQLKVEVAEKNIQLETKNKDLADIKGQMLQQEKMAAIGTLSAGLLHEVNNPLNFCMMAIDIAAEDPAAKTSASLEECLIDAKQGMGRIQHIISDLKAFAYRKVEDAMSTPFPFEKAVISAIRLTGHELKGVEVKQELPSDTIVTGDEASVVGVLINLLSNAAISMRGAGKPDPTIKISAVWAEDRLHITVEDNGPGIAPENLARVFEPFFTTREVGQGLGLGLSISYGVIQRHGGLLSAESVKGEWTKMIFDLPRKAERVYQ